jgi:peptidoglycan/LPS O-acetylase OafA/YrhL
VSLKIYLPGLNGFRAIAALAVVFSHINLNLGKFGLDRGEGLQLANFGVTIFFTLSGFLITYLLLCEQLEAATISINKFYVRRILRIWPLYFLYVFIVLGLFWSTTATPDLGYYIFFIPNVALALSATLPLLAHYWSLGVEEQFYAFWPWVVKKAGNLKLFLVIFIIVFVLVKVIVKFLPGGHTIQVLLHYTRFGCMAIGALGAYYWHTQPQKLKPLFHPIVEILGWGCIMLLFINRFHFFSIIDHELIAAISVLLMINQVQGKPLISLEYPVFDYLGKISFGLYVYNPLLIHLLAKSLLNSGISSDWAYYFLIYMATPLFIIGVAHVSYRYLERPFLKIKGRFSVVASRGSRTESATNH